MWFGKEVPGYLRYLTDMNIVVFLTLTLITLSCRWRQRSHNHKVAKVGGRGGVGAAVSAPIGPSDVGLHAELAKDWPAAVALPPTPRAEPSLGLPVACRWSLGK